MALPTRCRAGLAVAVAFAFLVVIPEQPVLSEVKRGDLLLSLFFRRTTTITGVPHASRTSRWVDGKNPTTHNNAVVSAFYPNCLYLFRTTPRNRHFDRSCSQPHREQRSGEIRFSTPTLPQPQPSCIYFSAFSAQKSHVKPPDLSQPRQPTHNKPNISLAKLEI
jgi:hypothetical protein